MPGRALPLAPATEEACCGSLASDEAMTTADAEATAPSRPPT